MQKKKGKMEMEIAGVIVGMILAFLLGAYVRKPFAWRRSRQQQGALPQEETPRSGHKRDKVAQLNNLLSYTGRVQAEEDFEN